MSEAAELQALASALLGEPLGVPERVSGGGNSRVFRIAGAGRRFALKRYPDGADGRERAEHEFGGLTFLWAAGERRVPEPVALDPAGRFALYAWLAGERPVHASAADIDALAAFARDLHARRDLPGAAALPLAREAVLADRDLFDQIDARLARHAAGSDVPPALLAEIRAQAERHRSAGARAAPLDRAAWTLSPSDFGVHNALRAADGLRFLDFEYFGWDDPVKLTADVLWHPAMSLDGPARQKFFVAAADCYTVDPTFLARFERHAPLYGLRWALIVLGEFLPDVWQRRAAAGAGLDRAAVLERQLAKASALLERVRRDEVLA